MWAVVDWINNCVHVFDSEDKPFKKFGSRGSSNRQFEYPCDVAFDDNNELYVTDSHNHRVQKFDHHGNYTYYSLEVKEQAKVQTKIYDRNHNI